MLRSPSTSFLYCKLESLGRQLERGLAMKSLPCNHNRRHWRAVSREITDRERRQLKVGIQRILREI